MCGWLWNFIDFGWIAMQISLNSQPIPQLQLFKLRIGDSNSLNSSLIDLPINKLLLIFYYNFMQ
jgi:hypothetical protein